MIPGLNSQTRVIDGKSITLYSNNRQTIWALKHMTNKEFQNMAKSRNAITMIA